MSIQKKILLGLVFLLGSHIVYSQNSLMMTQKEIDLKSIKLGVSVENYRELLAEVDSTTPFAHLFLTHSDSMEKSFKIKVEKDTYYLGNKIEGIFILINLKQEVKETSLIVKGDLLSIIESLNMRYGNMIGKIALGVGNNFDPQRFSTYFWDDENGNPVKLKPLNNKFRFQNSEKYDRFEDTHIIINSKY